jgi:sporulation protein YlmC with PRC-barrel domain
MERSAQEMIGYSVVAADGKAGKIYDVYLDDGRWRATHVVAVDSNLLSARRMAVPTRTIESIDDKSHEVRLGCSREELANGPREDSVQTASRIHALNLYRYHRWPFYWGNQPSAPRSQEISNILAREERLAQESIRDTHDGSRLRSVREMHGYHVQTMTGPAGRAIDFRLDDQSWAVLSVVVDIGSIFSEKDIIVAVARIKRISWGDKSVILSVGKKELIKAAA